MLEFDPNQRITAEQALQNSYFDEIRLPHQENIAPAEIDMTIDDLQNESITIEELKKIVVEVIQKHSSDNYDFGVESEEDEEEY